MINGKKILGVIPARGGSKSIPAKNVFLLAGKPLIYYIINTSLMAIKNEILDRCIVSTDNEEIAKIASSFGAEVPFLRPKEYSQDTSPDIEFMQHAFKKMSESGFKADILVNLRPTSPLLSIEDIKRAVEILLQSGGSSVRSVSQIEHNYHPYWLKRIEGNKAFPFMPGYDEKKYYNRQLLPPLFRLNAAVDVVRAENVTKGDLYGKDMRAYIMEKGFLDINQESDFMVAEAILSGKSHE